MRNKIIGLVIITLVFSYWFYEGKSEKVLPKQQTLSSTETKEEKNLKTKSEPNKNPKKSLKKVAELDVPEDILFELSQQQFSPEPIIELMSVTFLDRDCRKIGYMNIDSDESDGMKRVKTLQGECQKQRNSIHNDYPAYFEKKTGKDAEALFFKLAFQSKYANLIQRGMGMKFMSDEGKNQFFEDFFNLILTTENGPLIVSINEMFRESETLALLNKLSTRLGTINPSYTKLIIQQSTVLYSCQYNQSITCSPSSKYMIEQCYYHETACGLDVPTWFELNHTKAHNRDIAKMIRYFEGL